MSKLSKIKKEIETLEFNGKGESEPVKYIPALGFGFLTPFFDSFMKLGLKESLFKAKLVEQAAIHEGFKVLDLGCGTATLTILLKKSCPEAEVKGVDIDSSVLAIAKEKVAKANLDISFDLATAFELPYPDNYFDRVVSSLVFHHLNRENKVLTLKEVLRVLKPNGELHVADTGKPHNIPMQLVSLIMGRLEENADNIKGLLPKIFRLSGFEQVRVTDTYTTLFGAISLYKGRKPIGNPNFIFNERRGNEILPTF